MPDKTLSIQTLLFSSIIALNSCSGRDEPGNRQLDDCINAKKDRVIAADQCNSQETDPIAIALNTVLAGSVARDDADVYVIPSNTQVTLTTTSGNADLYLFNSPEFSPNTLLCAANNPFLEDTCPATSNHSEIYAIVDGHQASNYTIGVSDDCSVESINQWVYRNMTDYYLFADLVPEVDPTSLTNTSALVDTLRFDERDPYTNISDSANLDAFFNDGKSYGFGFDWRWDANDNARITHVYTDSESGRAGIKRGDIIVALEGERWETLSRERYFELVGNSDNPRTTSWTIIDGDTDTSSELAMTYGEFSVNTVLYLDAYTNPDFSGKLGYLVFNDFLRTSATELNTAIQSLADNGATELILDLRYNPGGFVDIAQRLASQIAGPSLAGNTLARDEHREKYAQANKQIQFIEAAPSLNLNRLVVLTSNSTASASELIINSLRSYIEVITIGTKTKGKSFVSSSRRFCGKSLNAMEAQTVNASGVSVEGGIEADCYAADDLTRSFGINPTTGETEGMLQAALDYFATGSCDTGPPLAKRSMEPDTEKTHHPRAAGLTRVPEYGLPDR